MLQRTGKLILALGLALMFGGCSLLPEAKPMQSWTLPPAQLEARGPVQMSDVRILRPQTQDLLGGSYLLVVPEGQPISVYKGARWSASIPNLWRDHLVTALQHDSRFARVSNDEVRVSARYELVSRLDAFQSEYRDGQPVVVMRGYLQLIDTDSRSIVAERALELFEPAKGKEVKAVVSAFARMMEQSSEDIRSWLLDVNPS
ncbi:ABC-type transport auxiliary lipoprotein family protein [Marinobacterium marinum]|uniref:Membrane integrity-associated transporter subunit PqiC n=1 Tax=Marinobacterium marinum TaxID=2756129 RepID=A0A7W1WVN3_9GAMM|nr:ABC-type transport auxiliary lipoprotein family protein [Marinobacterium marinum]MBA4500977.1 membrane integrity-associated transporter subunit PqiC [Marinobacterium marinum]